MTLAAEPKNPVVHERMTFARADAGCRTTECEHRLRFLPHGEIRGLLTSLRTLSDDRLCSFILLEGFFRRPLKWYITRFSDLQASDGFAEYVGPLAPNQIGVVLCAERQRVSDLLRRAEWYSQLLREEGAEDLNVHQYPVASPRESRFGSSRLPLYPEGGIEELFARNTPTWKRSIDIVLSLIGLICLAPLLAITALLVKVTSRGPVLFCQRRTGRGGCPFMMYKFRSMYYGSENRQHELRHLNEQDGPAFKIKHDPRVTPLGRLLRGTCIDELPQLWNVLRGEMSLVGPRPLPCIESSACAGWQRRRLNVTPGITCLWQMRGRTMVSFERWMKMDLEYIARQSLWFDLAIIAWTVLAIFHSFRWSEEN